MDLCIERKVFIFVKLHLKSVIDINALDCSDTGSLEACIWKNRANLPIFAHFLLSFSPLSKQDISDSRNMSYFFNTIWGIHIMAKN